jgi:hypothetical protein
MGSIEIEVAPLVISLAKGEKVSVGAGEAARLALWASIVAVLRSTQDPGRSSVRPEDVRYMREHSETPPDYIVWLLHGQPMWNFQTRHQRLFLEDQEGRMSPAHVTWFWIGHSVYVVAPSVAASWLGVLGLARSAVVILHPYGEYPITWPLRGEIARTAMIDMTNAIALPLESWWRGFEPREE